MASLSLNYTQSMNLLCLFKWSVITAQDKYLSDYTNIRKKLGFEISKKDIKYDDLSCNICCCDYDSDDDFFALDCGHRYCNNCWKTFLITEVNKGNSCIMSKCPEDKCMIRIPKYVFQKFLDEHYWNLYLLSLKNSFVSDRHDFVICPGDDCQYCCYYPEGGEENVSCSNCRTEFCFKCGGKNHKPATCDMVTKWIKKNEDESGNIVWLKANTKPCPKCHVNIEKNQGCNHMTCRNVSKGCGYEFCWMYYYYI